MSVPQGSSGWVIYWIYTAAFFTFILSPPVASDLRVVDKWANSIAFQTASDFVRTGCGSFLNKSRIVVAEPLDACTIPNGPPEPGSFLARLYQTVFEDPTEEEKTQWVLVASGDGDCDLKTKFRNAASAGYAGIILGTEEAHEDIIHPGMFTEDDEEFIDVHLVSPLDIQVLSKGFASNQFVVDPPCLTGCKEEYQRTWLRSRYVSLMLRIWKRFMEMCWECIKALLLMAGTMTRSLKVLVPSVFYTRDSFSKIAMYLASIIISITIMMIISIRNTYKKIMKYKDFQQRRTSVTEDDTNMKDKRRTQTTNQQNEFNSNSRPYTSQKQSYEYWSYTPPPPRRSSPAPPINRVPIDYTRYHRINLDMKLNEPLTRSRVNNAYRELALKYHPDKNLHLNEIERAKLTEEFRSKTKSRDVLLCYCPE